MGNIIITLYPLLCIILPCLLYLFLQTRKSGIYLTGVHFIWIFIFLLYLHLVLEATGIGTIWDIGSYDSVITLNKMNLIPFRDVFALSQLLNIVMFMPLGFLLPLIWKEFRSPLKVVLAGMGYSFGIEFCQMFNNRVTDIDDLIMNTLGALAGYCVWIVYVCLFHPKESKKEVSLSAKEPVWYLFLSVAGQFFFYNWRWMVTLFFS